MRILQLHNLHAAMGGAPGVMEHEADLLRGAGHVVDQYTYPSAEELGLSSLTAGLKAVWNREAAAEVARRVKCFAPDVVHVHTPFPLMSPSVFRAAKRAGVPTVTTLHSFRYACVAGTCVRDDRVCEDCIGSRLKLAGVRHRCYHDSMAASGALTAGLVVHRAIGTFDRHVDRYLTLTEFARQLLIRDGFPPDKIVVKPNSTPDLGASPDPGPDQRRVVFAGRLIDIKGVRTLLDAWAHVPRGLTLVIAGDGPLRGLVEERALADSSIEYLGWVDEDQVTSHMARAEAVIVPSEWYEGLPLVILRSLSVGTPLIVADMENFSAAVMDDEAGWSFAPRDSIDLGRQLTHLLEHREEALAKRPAARRSYEARYSPAVDLRRLEVVYRSVAKPS